MSASLLAAMLLTTAAAAPARECPASRLRNLVGETPDDAIRRKVVRTARGERVRWIPVGSAVTQDWVPRRINLDLDERGRIVRIWCG